MAKPDEYATPAATWTAIRAASGKASVDRGVPKQDLLNLQLFDRFLARVFSGMDAPFILKGGTRMLAFIPRARATVDVDLETSISDIASAVTQLERLVDIDIGDRLRFTLLKQQRRQINNDQPNITMVSLTFEAAGLGQIVKVDLAVHDRAGLATVRASPVFRVPLARSVPTPEYVMIAIEQQIADKVAAMMESHHGGPDGRSSRAKDLVDLALIAQHLSCDAKLLREALEVQILERKLTPFTLVTASPAIQKGYSTAARKAAGLHLTWQEAEDLTNRLIGPILDGTTMTGIWNPHGGGWQA
ncbi:Nucleotidyl transferase AbiEii toxin, Type IV TA system [Agreia bicolorata]|uniref:Nucleotidyl transferase AbiEii toxin, Type IV TA system n=1 Tax=Agreia bicolorata TaxID=110935 RepID=A0A1T4YMA8_9MICO|nr:nucleotidyl transferase AbiEii/AbiGii toxin family protein [Agreia bicolorata]SKB02415.1 Nucleotidyl transferase AbiEii toxin, Type IV TA system [Agreia bicolorata]